MYPNRVKAIALSVALACSTGLAQAELNRTGPVSNDPTIGGYPAWFQDKTGLTLDFCSLLNQAELDGGWCVLIPPGPVAPEAFPDSFFDEHFYWAADNGMTDPATGTKARLVVAIEAAFVNGAPATGDQMTFGRIRVFVPRLPYAGDYRVITPFTDITYRNRAAGDKLFETEDIGVACPGTFDCTLATRIGPFLVPSPVAGGPEVPPIPDLGAGVDPWYDLVVNAGASTAYPNTGRRYLADPARIGPVTGSPLADFIDNTGAVRNHNTFRIEGPNGFVLDGETNFTVAGRIMESEIPGQAEIRRASYARTAAGVVTKLDVFATAAETQQARLPAAAIPPKVTPILSFYNAPCGGAIAADGVTVNPPPYTAPVAGTPTSMANTGPNFWGQSVPASLPQYICMVDATATTATGQVVPAYYLKKVTDDVTVTAANFNGPSNGTLSVNAVSSDALATLTLAGFGGAPVSAPTPFASSATGIVAAPNTVVVSSDKGGQAVAPVTTAVGTTILLDTPVASADNYTMFEDCAADAANQGIAVVCPAGGRTFDPVENDTVTVGGVPTTVRASGLPFTVTIVTPPRLGTATVNADGSINYRPNPNASGADGIIYKVTMGGFTSNNATAVINVTPVNDLPAALGETVGAVVGRANRAALMSNDTDPDGNADVRNVAFVTWPVQLGAQPVPVGGVINYTPAATGTFIATYRVIDAAGAQSANIANATIVVAGSEAITIQKAIYKIGNIGGGLASRWTVAGLDSVPEGQQLTVAYNNGRTVGGVSCNGTQTSGPCFIGNATVDGSGNWTLDFLGTPGGTTDPTDAATWSAKPSSVRVFSSNPVLGGGNTLGISLK